MKRIWDFLKGGLACMLLCCCTKDYDLKYKTVLDSTWVGQGLTVKFVMPKIMSLERGDNITEYSYHFTGKERIECVNLTYGGSSTFTIRVEGAYMKFGNDVLGYYNLQRKE